MLFTFLFKNSKSSVMSSDQLQWLCFLMKSQNDVKGNVEMCEYFSNSRRILLVVDNFHVN